MIQDIAPHQFFNEYKPVKVNENSIILYYEECSVMVAEQEEICFPRLEDFNDDERHFLKDPVYLFSIDNESYFYARQPVPAPEGFEMKDISIFRQGMPRHQAFAGITGYSLANWYLNHTFCGRCAEPMKHHERERMLNCPMCGNMEYPKISPAVIVGVTNGNRLLLTKYANREYSNYALLAGFTEIGESIEDTITREVMEEVGLKVKNIQFYKSQPWSFTDCLLLGYFVELDGDDTVLLDRTELAVAEWFEREEVPPGNASLSLTGDMIEFFRNAK